jgi:endo-alpha-1,4-polygalactosaminidase (GH114 family)
VKRPVRLSAALLASAFLVTVCLSTPGWAQPRQLGPPPGTNLEDSGDQAAEPPPAPEPEPEPPPPPPPPIPDKAPADRLREQLRNGSTELLDIPLTQIPNYRDQMRDIVEQLSSYIRGRDKKAVVIVHNGFDLLYRSQREFDLAESKRDPNKTYPAGSIWPVGMPMRRYIQAIDGFVLDGQFCSPLRVPRADLAAARKEGLKALSFDHCKDNGQVIDALRAAVSAKIVTFADDNHDAEFKTVPARRPIPENPAEVESLSAVRNMLPLFSSKSYPSRADWLTALYNNNYDMVIIEAFDRTDRPLTKQEVHDLKFKQMGARRLVLARVDVGHADDSRFYFGRDWMVGNPSWLIGLGPDYLGQYEIEFWNPAWKSIIGKYVEGIMDLGFDGVLIDGVDAYRLWEAKTPLAARR